MVRDKWFTRQIAAVALTGLLPLALPGIALALNDGGITVALNDGRETIGDARRQAEDDRRQAEDARRQAEAEDRSPIGVGKKPLSIGLRGTYYIAEGSDNIRLFGGVQARLHFHKAFALELSADYRQEMYNKNAQNVTTHIDVIPVQLSLLAYLMPGERFSPFLLAGPGYYYTHLITRTQQDNAVQHRFGAHAGGGVQFFLNEHISLDATYRYVWTQAFQEKLLNGSVQSFNDRGSQITFGLNWHF